MRISDWSSDVCSSDLAYRASEQRLRTITDNVPGLVSHLDRNGRFVFVNRAHFAWYGLEASAFIGKTFIEVFGEQASCDPAVVELVKRSPAGDRQRGVEGQRG